MKLASVDEMRFMDNFAAEKLGISGEILMENAAGAAVCLLQKEVGIKNKKFVVFCGSGNNGGDGLALARLLHSRGAQVKVFLLGDEKRYQGAAKTNYDILRKLPVSFAPISTASDAGINMAHSDVIIDAIFGTGLDRQVDGPAAAIIEFINSGNKKILSLDIPSGINGNTGAIMGIAVKAHWTVTFGLPKIGNLLYPGYERCGKLLVTHISFPPSLYEQNEIKTQTNGYVQIPARPGDAYKGSMGEVLFVAGAANYYGAPYFSAMSFLKSGGGYARLAAPRSIIGKLASRGREIVYLPQDETKAGSIAARNKKGLLEAAAKTDMVVIGPGLSLQEETVLLARELCAEIEAPLLIDGDGLTALAGSAEILKNRKAPTILTPHDGEMARLAQISVAQVNADRVGLLRKMAEKLNSIVVLKGAHSLIGLPDGQVFVNLSGNAGMATAGSGDVLTGCIAAMHGLGLKPELAARKGVFLHGYAGDLAAVKKGADGIIARDIMEFLPQALKDDRAGRIAADCYEPPVI